MTELHCHSRCSDGADSPSLVVSLCKKQGVDLLALTDHDTFSGSDKARLLCMEEGIGHVEGLELSCRDYVRNRKVHLLCYAPKDRGPLEEHCRRMTAQRSAAGEEMARKVAQLFCIDMENIREKSRESGIIYKQHIMDELIQQGFATEMFGKRFSQLFDEKNGSCFVNIVYPDIEDMIRLVHDCGGIAVMAHPGNYHGMDLMRALCKEKKIDGVECYHPKNTPLQQEEIKSLVEQNGLLLTGGTDYHGSYSKRTELPGDNSLSAAQTEKFLARCTR